MRKRFYIVFVARDDEGQLQKIPIPLPYLYVFLVGAVIGMLTITGMAGSYTRMLLKTSHFNQLRAEKDQIKQNYSKLEKVDKEKDVQVASLGSIAGEVSTLYGLKRNSNFLNPGEDGQPVPVQASIDKLYALRNTALSGAALNGSTVARVQSSDGHTASLTDWVQAASVPAVWPVQGRIGSGFGERIDPFNGEGAFHSGLDISAPYGTPVRAPADGIVTFTDFSSGYGRLLKIEHGHGISTRYGHLSGFAVHPGQSVKRGEVIAYVGATGRATSPHLHYEVRIRETPVNPKKYLRTSISDAALADRSR